MAGAATITGKQHYVLAIGHPVAEPINETPPMAIEAAAFPDAGIVVLSSDAPSDSDGRPNGTIYIKTA